MKEAIVLMSLLISLASAEDKSKPVLLIRGDGNITANSSGGVVGGQHWASGYGTTHVNKHDQTMEMAQDLLQVCPNVETTLDQAVTPDYYVALNREGYGSWDIGQSQIMLLNRLKTVLFVTKKGTVKNAVKAVCNAIMADWQTHGRLAVSPPASAAPAVETPGLKQELGQQAAPASKRLPKTALDIQVTANAQKRCKPQTITDIMNDTSAYLTAKGVAVGTTDESNYMFTLVVDRPMTKWVEITVQARDKAGNLLWSEKASGGGHGFSGTNGMLKALEKVHQAIDAKLGAENGLPLLSPAAAARPLEVPGAPAVTQPATGPINAAPYPREATLTKEGK